MIERIAELVREKRIEGISELRDESDRHGMRVVIELKRDASAQVVLNQLYRFSELQTSFGVNMLALNGGRPVLMNLKEMVAAFVLFREEVVTRRTRHELAKARERGHTLVGLAVAVANIDGGDRTDTVGTRRGRPGRPDGPRLAGEDVAPANRADRRSAPSDRGGQYHPAYLEEQAKAILDLRLAAFDRAWITEYPDEVRKLGVSIADYLDICARGRACSRS